MWEKKDPGSESEPGALKVLEMVRVIFAMYERREISRIKNGDGWFDA